MVVRARSGRLPRLRSRPAPSPADPVIDFPQTIRYTDLNSYFLGTGPTSPANVSGYRAVGPQAARDLPVQFRNPEGHRIQNGGGHRLCRQQHASHSRNWNYNLLPSGIRFLPSSRDVTKPPTAASPGAYDDVFLRPIQGFGDINISTPGTNFPVRFAANFSQSPVSARLYILWRLHLRRRHLERDFPTVARRSLAAPANTAVQHHVGGIQLYVVELPKGSKLLPGAVTRQVLDGWQFQGISTFATGQVSNVSFGTSDGFDFTGGGESCGIVQTGNAGSGRGQRTIDYLVQYQRVQTAQRPRGPGQQLQQRKVHPTGLQQP